MFRAYFQHQGRQETKPGGIPVQSECGGPAVEKLKAKLSLPYYPDQEKYFDISASTEKIKDSTSSQDKQVTPVPVMECCLQNSERCCSGIGGNLGTRWSLQATGLSTGVFSFVIFWFLINKLYWPIRNAGRPGKHLWEQAFILQAGGEGTILPIISSL